MKIIKKKALYLLSRKAYFKKELRLKLSKYGFKKEDIESSLCELERLGLLEENDLAQSFVQKQMRKGYGSKVIWYKLREKAGDVIASTFVIEENEEILQKLIQKYLQKKHFQNRQKIVLALLRRGYALEMILKNLKS